MLHVRACQVTDEIICLLENGLADGAMARRRTLHEIGMVAAVLSQHGEDMAEHHLAHEAVESKRAMVKYLTFAAALGYKPLSQREVNKIAGASRFSERDSERSPLQIVSRRPHPGNAGESNKAPNYHNVKMPPVSVG
jgi:hypothetical protein